MTDRPIEYRGNTYPADVFERQFNPRADNPDIGLQLEERSAMAASTRERLAFTPDISYGPSPRQTLDIFPGQPDRRGECADLLFFHGGYWRAGHGSENCFVAEAFVDAGATVVMASYDLCPHVRIGTIVAQACQALEWLTQNGDAHAVDSNRLWIGGHSAGRVGKNENLTRSDCGSARPLLRHHLASRGGLATCNVILHLLSTTMGQPWDNHGTTMGQP